jgi:hypothetical protein
MPTKTCDCGTVAPAELMPFGLSIQRHKAPCGVICSCGCRNGEGYRHDEPRHEVPWNGPPETDGHYHGACPAGCFVNCCKPRGNLCGPKCLQCFGCKSCGFIHAVNEPCVESQYA